MFGLDLQFDEEESEMIPMNTDSVQQFGSSSSSSSAAAAGSGAAAAGGGVGAIPPSLRDLRGHMIVDSRTQLPLSILPEPFRCVFNYPRFNSVQSACFKTVFDSDQNVIVSAPTGHKCAANTSIATKRNGEAAGCSYFFFARLFFHLFFLFRFG